MTNEVNSIINWIYHNIDKKSSLWNSFIHNGHLPNLPHDGAKSVVYVTGSTEKMKEVHDIFMEIDDEFKLTILSNNDIHPLLKWFTICYIPSQKLAEFPVDRLVAFTNGRPEKWVRHLLKAKKISGLVGWTNQIIDEWEVSWNTSYKDFTSDLLLQDKWIYKQSSPIQIEKKIKVTVPQLNSLKNSLILENIDEMEISWRKELDNIASQLIHSIWILNDFRIRDFSPLFLQLVEDYLTNIRDIFAHESNVERIELLFNEWIGGDFCANETGE